ncbi:MAG: PKD domain-containing protein [Chitinophagaceae bacterium]
MHQQTTYPTINLRHDARGMRSWYVLVLAMSLSFAGFGQSCPPNIDFETGDFSGWTCYTGYVTGIGNQNMINLTPSGGPVSDRHTMMSAIPGNGVDEYGGFPVNCPNGSGHSIKLGNNTGGGEAEGISYEFIIPANEPTYNLIYNYAVVFQDPNHLEFQQPRMEIEITNVTDNVTVNCSSFTFYPYGSPLPGFQLSDNPGSATPVYYKDWSAVSINLDGHAGKRIRLFFKTADCTFRRHFGYAYIDVNSECSGSFVGATFCHDDSVVYVTAPHGYQTYSWYNRSFTQLLGSSQVLRLAPPPPPGTIVGVVLVPYNGYGCLDTLYASLVDTLHIKSNAGKDTISCNLNAVPIGAPPKPGLFYQWTPTNGLSNANISNPLAAPEITTTYVLRTNSAGGGCVDFDTVIVRSSVLDNTLEFEGSPEFCTGSGDSAVMRVMPAFHIQWYRNDAAIPGASGTVYRILQTGKYYALLTSAEGCILKTIDKIITISSIPVVGFTVNNPDQCLSGNLFNFTNTSTNAVGQMRYEWALGDGVTDTTRNLIHKYASPGTYPVKLLVRSSAVCADSSLISINVFPNAIADFTAATVCVNLPAEIINKTSYSGNSTVNYSWTLGNGQVSTAQIPPAQVYTSPGSYSYSLTVNTNQCPSPLSVVKHNLLVESPRPAIRYPEQGAVINLPAGLQARPFGTRVFWSPQINLDDALSVKPTFKGSADQLYTIKITTASGCETIDTQFVKIYKQVEVFVPTAFTPNNDSKNDILRPVLIGIKEIRGFRIFNRWGNLMFETKDEKAGWDGNYRGEAQQTQSVIWTFEGIGGDGLNYLRKGVSTLVR